MLLKLTQVDKTFDGPVSESPLQILSGVDLEVETGESIAIVGPSGSGKSTLLHIMGGLDVPSLGSVRLGGRNLVELGEAELSAVRNSEVGFVFQLHHLLPQCTVLQNCLLPTLPASAEVKAEVATARALRLLHRVGLEERVDHRPGQLSGGECQRVAVVRALINSPRLLLADEPTGSLDGASADKLGKLLVELNREEKVSLVVVTHAMELARRMGRVFRLENGRLEELPGGLAAA